MAIRQLADHQIDQIAAGEVVERPASVVKELVENAIDAGATRIAIATAGGGKSLIRVTDDGDGIPPDELPLAVRRHCTSKLDGGLDAIAHLGFRGEALPSIGAVAKLGVTSRTADGDSAWQVAVGGGTIGPVRPAALSRGTVVEVRDLFHNVPARLKFLKTDRAENAAIAEVVRRIAVAFPGIAFELSGPDRASLALEAFGPDGVARRLADVLGADFCDNALPIDASRDDVALAGYAGLPTFNRGTARHQFFYVNGRPVRDKTLLSALRGAYADLIAKDRHPVAALFLSLDPALVDVNVHPAKADVRFRDAGHVRGLIVGALKQTFAQAGLRPSTADAAGLVARARTSAGGWSANGTDSAAAPRFAGYAPGGFAAPRAADYRVEASPFRPLGSTDAQGDTAVLERSEPGVQPMPESDERDTGERYPLGAARAQLHGNFIVAETDNGVVLVDQHAAHERLVYERLKTALHGGERLASQLLLIPEIVDLPPEDVARIDEEAERLATLGLGLEAFGPGAIAVRETPALLGAVDVRRLVRDLADELAQAGTALSLRERIDHVAATVACHGSVRAGRQLKPDEMNALLREMEVTPGAGQCNHGRPTFITLTLADIEAMFGRR